MGCECSALELGVVRVLVVQCWTRAYEQYPNTLIYLLLSLKGLPQDHMNSVVMTTVYGGVGCCMYVRLVAFQLLL